VFALDYVDRTFSSNRIIFLRFLKEKKGKL